VPLILRGPGVPRGERREAQCYLRDLFPTACDSAGLATPPAVQGRSLLPALRDPRATVHPFVVGYFTDTQRAIREGSWKLVLYPRADRMQLFDLARDPDEIVDLSAQAEHAARRAELHGKLVAWLEENGDPAIESVRRLAR
jgi:arylsulfatase A-like enzyme